MNRKPHSSPVRVDSQNYVYVDGVKIARYIPENQCIQFIDKDRIRSNERGSNLVEVPLALLASIGKKE